MRIQASILIRRRINAVFSFLSTPVCLPSWVAGVTIADGLQVEEQGVGATFVLQRAGCTGRSTWEVTAYEPPRALALRGLDEVAGAEVRWTLEGVPSGATRVWVEADLAVVSFFQPVPRQLEQMGTRQLEVDLEVLRSRLEADASEASRGLSS